MKYPIVLTIPILMLCDYYLTIIGSILYRRGYYSYFKLEQYELNPQWQSSINKRKWFNARYLILVVLATALTVFISETGAAITTWLPEFFIAVMVVLFAALVGRHLSNILTFNYVIRHPEEISGQVQMSYKMTINMSQYQILMVLCPFIVVAFSAGIPFVLGGLLGLMIFWKSHWTWLKKYNKNLNKQNNPSN